MLRFLDGRRLGESKGQRYQGQRWKCGRVEHDAEERRCNVNRFEKEKKVKSGVEQKKATKAQGGDSNLGQKRV